MAKVDSLTFEISGKKYLSNINVGKKGIFKCELHWQVENCLGIESPIQAATLEEVKRPIIDAYHEYLNAQKTYALYIKIEYKANKNFAYNSEGHAMFELDSDFRMNGGFHELASQLHFGYRVFCKEENSTGNDIWYKVTKFNEGDENTFDEKIVDGYMLSHQEFGAHGLLIPYTPESLETLQKATEGIRSISEILNNFLSQSPDLIAANLHGGKLLPNTKQIDD